MYIDLNVTTRDDVPFLNVTAGSSADFLNNPLANYMMSQERHLKKSDDLVVDFTVFAMAVVTMSLLLIVEVLRHKVDHLAKGKEIFEHVLEAVYRELSTLGIVEAIVFLVQHYYKDMNKTVKQAFYEVHFTLFYVAIINAIMSCLLYFFASRVAEKQWVRLEKVDLDHYVAIRKQFDAFKEQLQAIKKSKDASKKSGLSLRQDKPPGDTNVIFQLLTESRIPFLKANLKKMLNNKYRKLLVQVRFHELRVHFIEINGLDPRFCVSTYLKLCMNDVFKSLVHISTFSWLILLGCTNLVYFGMGIITAETNNKKTVGTSLSFIYVGYSLFFVIFSIIIGWKVKKIFFTIMKHEEWVNRNESLRNIDDKSQEGDNFHQLDYFWGSDPTIIIVVCQFMQFGFALALGILLVFNGNIYDQQSPFHWVGWYFVAPIACYALFVYIWSGIIPQYTQCTNLGELINEKHLNDTRAAFELNEARLLRQDEIDFDQLENKRTGISGDPTSLRRENPSNKDIGTKTKSLKKMISGSIADNRILGVKDDFDVVQVSSHSSLRMNHNLLELSDLVKRPSKDLPEVVPYSRDSSKRSVSAGVASMREGLFSRKSLLATEALNGELTPQSQDPAASSLFSTSAPFPDKNKPVGNRLRPLRTKAVSTGVFLMQSERSQSFFDDKSDNKLMAEGLSGLSVAINNSEMSPIVETLENEHSKMAQKTSSGASFSKEMPSSTKHNKPSIVSIREENCIDEHDHEGDDDRSDVVPDITGIDKFQTTKTRKELKVWLEHLFMKKSYRQASAVFGTMVAFFMIAIRIELILLDTCFIFDNQNTWNFITRQTAFWIFVIWLCGFIVEGCTQIVIFRKSGSSPYMIISGSFDCVLSLVCLAIFLRAEVERCCDCDTTSLNRFLQVSYDSNVACDPNHPCCPEFGNRLCGGIGKLEPIASIIAFRVMRFYIAKKLWRSFRKLSSRDSKGIKSREEDSSESQELMVEFTSKRREKAKDKLCRTHNVNFEHDTGTIAKLWSSAILKYPEIVSNYGMFSGYLLEAMLGIEHSPQIDEKAIGSQSHNTLLPQTPNKVLGNLHSAPSASRWKSMVDRHANRNNSDMLSSIGDDWDEEHDYFIRPEAPLIRKMRRCQCKWLPLLEEWQVVDVVVTNYEIVWMEPKSMSEMCDKFPDLKKQKGQSFSVDNGGRGISLCDAIKGRKVIGRLPTSDISHVKVQRFPPADSDTSSSDEKDDIDIETALDAYDFAFEFWDEKSLSSKNFERSLCKEPHERFSRVIEDHLVLQTPHGTLHLRFLVDLVEEEKAIAGSETIDLHSLRWKEGALLWCQTIAHLCGPQQLKQKLHHVGEERDKELLDFLEVLDKKRNETPFRLIGRH